MLKVKPEDRPLLGALLAIAFGLYLIWGASPTPQTQPTNSKPQPKTEQHTPPGDLWNWLAKDSISFFTFVLAVFTGVLVLYNGRQISLARSEFLATHRPRVKVRWVGLTEAGENSRFAVIVLEGTITYADKAGLNRTTGFSREYLPDPGTFRRHEPHAEDEYED